MIDYSYNKIKKFYLHARQSLEYLLNHFCDSFQTFSCPMHEKTGKKLAGRIVINIFLNNKRIISTSEVAVDHVKSFKKRKFEKTQLNIYNTIIFYFGEKRKRLKYFI